MQKMYWTAAMYGTGNETVDEQHRKLFDLINVVLDSLEKKRQPRQLKANGEN